MSTEKQRTRTPGSFGSPGRLSAQEAGRRSQEAQKRKREEERLQLERAASSVESNVEIERRLRLLAAGGNTQAAKILADHGVLKLNDPEREREQKVLEQLSPELRDFIATELNGGEVPDFVLEHRRRDIMNDVGFSTHYFHLSPAQHRCIELATSGRHVPEEQALAAWCGGDLVEVDAD